VAAVVAASGAAVSGVAGVAVSGVAAVAVSGVAAHAGERAAFAKLHDLADERQNLTNCRAGISAGSVQRPHPGGPCSTDRVKRAPLVAVLFFPAALAALLRRREMERPFPELVTL
jgi:hypothetical protein